LVEEDDEDFFGAGTFHLLWGQLVAFILGAVGSQLEQRLLALKLITLLGIRFQPQPASLKESADAALNPICDATSASLGGPTGREPRRSRAMAAKYTGSGLQSPCREARVP
jgi:hypothetical protein